MSPRVRALAFVGLAAPLALLASVLALSGGEGLAGPADEPAGAPRMERPADRLAASLRKERAASEHDHARALHRHRHSDGPVDPRGTAFEAAAAKRAVPVAERFLAAYLRYELGEPSPDVGRELAATATPRFARELRTEPPRRPPAARAPEPAQMAGEPDFVPLRAGKREERIAAAEVVVRVRRQGTEGLLAVAMRLGGGRWRVSGLGR